MQFNVSKDDTQILITALQYGLANDCDMFVAENLNITDIAAHDQMQKLLEYLKNGLQHG